SGTRSLLTTTLPINVPTRRPKRFRNEKNVVRSIQPHDRTRSTINAIIRNLRGTHGQNGINVRPGHKRSDSRKASNTTRTNQVLMGRTVKSRSRTTRTIDVGISVNNVPNNGTL